MRRKLIPTFLANCSPPLVNPRCVKINPNEACKSTILPSKASIFPISTHLLKYLHSTTPKIDFRFSSNLIDTSICRVVLLFFPFTESLKVTSAFGNSSFMTAKICFSLSFQSGYFQLGIRYIFR